MSSGPTLLTLVLVLLPNPAYSSSNLDPLLYPDPGSHPGLGLPGPLDEMIAFASPPLTCSSSEAITIVYQIELLFPLDTQIWGSKT